MWLLPFLIETAVISRSCNPGMSWCDMQSACLVGVSTCAQPPSDCLSWDNGCGDSCRVSRSQLHDCRPCIMPISAPRCLSRATVQPAVQATQWVGARPATHQQLAVEVSATPVSGEAVRFDISVALPECLFLTALYGSEEALLRVPSALDIARPGGSAIVIGPDFASVGVDIPSWTSEAPLVVDNGAWFTIPDTQADMSSWRQREPLVTVILDHADTMTFNLQLTSCHARSVYHIVGLVAQLFPERGH